MVIERKQYVDREQGLLDRSIFVDEELYAQELERVFGRAWLFIGHESLVPNPNDFFLTYMGEDPVILTRDAKGQVHAFLNMCRHRGNRVARADDGNAKNFMCTYHGWTYSNDGKLVSVPGLQEAYYGELDVDKLGLVSVAQIDTYAGFVFATWDLQAPSLEDYLGDMRWYFDTMVNKRDGGVELIGPEKWIIPNNWKLSADNFAGDGYHIPITHRSAFIARAKALGKEAPSQFQTFERPSTLVAPGNGHGLISALATSDEDFSEAALSGQRHPKMIAYWDEIRPEVERRLGFVRARRVTNTVGTVFPNMSFLFANGTVRMWHPRGPREVELWAFVAVDKAASEEIKAIARTQSMRSFGVSGLLEQDDMDNWGQCTNSGLSRMARTTPQNLSMGIGRERAKHDVMPGITVECPVGELPQRALYNRWQEMMNAESWADISVDPSTATYEGTATFKG